MLASDDTHQTQAQLLTHWLDERYGWRPDAQTFETFQALLERAGQVLYQAIYVRDHVFHRHSQVPESYGQAVWSLFGQLNRNHWLPGSEREVFFSAHDVEVSPVPFRGSLKRRTMRGRRLPNCVNRRCVLPTQRHSRGRSNSAGWRSGRVFHSTASCFYAQKAFFTLRFAREVENSWSMREICQINIQELYRSAAEMDDYCAKHADASRLTRLV
jgi:hypothetical protein